MTHKMTEHGMARLRERARIGDHGAAAREILDALDAGRAAPGRQSVDGKTVYEWHLTQGGFIFPVVAGGDVVTVLSEGMEMQTPEGSMMLKRTPIEAGIHKFTGEQYRADPCPEPALSSSLAKKMLAQSPKHAWVDAPALNPNWKPKVKKTFDIGRAAHRRVLGAGGDYTTYPESVLASNGAASTKAAKEFEADCRARGITPLKEEEAEQIERMAEVCHAALDEMGIYLDPACSEQVAVAKIDGTWCRMMADNVPVDPRFPIIDFKTIEDANPAACRRAVESYGYDVQWRHYVETWREATGEDRDFLFVFQEKIEPWEIGVIRLLASEGHSEDWLEDARDKIGTARRTWRKSLDTGVWEGYPRMIVEIGANPYFRQRWQNRQTRESATNFSPTDILNKARKWQAPETLAGE